MITACLAWVCLALPSTAAPSLQHQVADPLGSPLPQSARLLSDPEGPAPRAEVLLPELGLTLVDTRQVEPDGRVARRTTDALGLVVDLDGLRRADHARGLERRRKLAPQLEQALSRAGASERLTVALWLVDDAESRSAAQLARVSTNTPAGDMLLHNLRDERRAWAERLRARTRTAAQAVAGAVTAAGGEVLYSGGSWPVVVARCPVRELYAIAAHPAVEIAYSAPEGAESLSACAGGPVTDGPHGTMRTATAAAAGGSAGGVSVMVNDDSHVMIGNPWLPTVVTLNSGWELPHATGVAGNIANGHPDHTAAGADLGQLYSLSGVGSAKAPTLWEYALTQGIDMGNCSWGYDTGGAMGFLERFFDYTVRNYGVMAFIAAGNSGAGGSPWVWSPALAYNVVASGTFDAQGTPAWADDQLTPLSSWKDPLAGHRKPDLVAPGTNVVTTGNTPSGLTTGFWGTSSASPLTCGVAALLAGTQPLLLTEPTTLKAALIVSAWQDVEPGPVFSEIDGAGAVHAGAAHALVRDGQWDHAAVTPADFPGGLRDVQFSLIAGDETRVAAVWFAKADSAYSSDVLELDVDLVVLDPSGTPVASSASALDPFELLSFVPATSGTYTARLTLQRFDGTLEPLTVAWSSRSDAAEATLSLAAGVPFAVAATPVLNFDEPFDGAWRPYFAWAGLSGPTGQPLPGGYTLPAAFDALGVLVNALPGFNGLLDASGHASAAFPLPPMPSLVGLELHFGLVVLAPGGAAAIHAVAPELVLTIAP